MRAMPAARFTELGSLEPPGALADKANVKRIEPRAGSQLREDERE